MGCARTTRRTAWAPTLATRSSAEASPSPGARCTLRLTMPTPPRPRVVVLSGAGISAESGLQTFRGAGGLWHQHRFEDLASPEGFARNPSLVLDFYNERRERAWAAEPNAAH